MKKKIASFILFSMIAVLASAAIRKDNVVFRRLSVHDGLSESQVNCIYKDSEGFLWIGTTLGLNRYDGFRFKTFFTKSDASMSLPNNNVSEIKEDASKHLWIKTSLGYCIFDPLTETFNNNIKQWQQAHGIKGIPGLVDTDRRHNLWFTIDHVGCYYYDFSLGKSFFIPQGAGNQKLPKGVITHIAYTDGNPVFVYNDGTLAKVDVASKKVAWINRYIPQHGGDKFKGYGVFIDRNHNYWVYTGEKAMAYMSKTKKWQTFDKMVKDIVQDRDGHIWIATDHEGLIVLDASGKVINNLKNDQGDNRSIPDNTLQCLYLDNMGILWVGTYKNGLAFHYEGQTTFANIPIGDVCTIAESDNGDLWCGMNDSGIIQYSPATGQTRHYEMSSTHLGSDIVVCSLRAHDGALWFGSYRGGLTCYRNGTFTAYRKSAGGLTSDNIWSIVEDRNGNIILGTLGAGLQILNPNTKKFTTYNRANSGLECDYISSLCFDTNGNIIIGHAQDFSIMNAVTHKITNYHKTRSGKNFSSPTVNQIYCDTRGLIWSATASGLNVYDRQTDQLSVINLQAKTDNTDVCAITEDRQGMIWVTSSNTVSSVRVRNMNGEWNFFVNSFGEADGLQSRQYNMRSILVSSKGNVIVGGFDGINIISPLLVTSKKYKADVMFSGLVVFDHPVSVGEEFNNRIILNEALNVSRRLHLRYNENAFTVQLASSNLAIPERSRFLYRLKGFNDRWMMTGESQASVTFTNLASGDYQLEVKLIDYNGNALSPVNTLNIRITPPFYASAWAYLIYFILIISSVFYIRRRMILRRRENMLLAEAERQRKVDNMKQVFFINISHELRTPLSLIISPLAGIITKESNDEIRKKLKLINRNALKLLEMINQMLDLRRLMVNGEHLHLNRGEVIQFVRGICDQFLSLTDKHITLTFYSSMTELMMNFDSDKLGKIINNLLSNAFKFTPNNGRVDVSINIVKNETTGQGQKMELKVSDNGIGISDKDKEHIFERFYQADTNSGHGGSGIGLNLVSEYTHLHGGEVTVTDNPGGGTVFIITLPIDTAVSVGSEFVDAQESEQTEVNTEEHIATEEDSADKPLPLLLLVDDSDDFLEFMSSELGETYHVVIAHNGVEALNEIEQRRPDIILTDVMMPEMDGNQLCHLLKRDSKTSNIPIVMLTARLSEENEMESRECGADDYITKPFNIEILKMHIQNLLKWRPVGMTGKLEPQIRQEQITSLDEKLVQDATQFVEQNISESELTVVSLSEALNMSRVNLYRKLLSVTGKTPSEFIRLIRLRHAEQLLMKSQLSISEISYRVGFSSQRYFSKCYKDLYGYMPSQYKRNKEPIK